MERSIPEVRHNKEVFPYHCLATSQGHKEKCQSLVSMFNSSSFTLCFCLMFTHHVWSAPAHCSFIWWITCPNAAPLTKPGFSSGTHYNTLCSVLIWGVSCCLVPVCPRAGANPWLLQMPAAPATLALWAGPSLCLWDSLMVLFIICIGNEGLLHPGLCFPWWLQIW